MFLSLYLNFVMAERPTPYLHYLNRVISGKCHQCDNVAVKMCKVCEIVGFCDLPHGVDKHHQENCPTLRKNLAQVVDYLRTHNPTPEALRALQIYDEMIGKLEKV